MFCGTPVVSMMAWLAPKVLIDPYEVPFTEMNTMLGG
jgi:hypothetical protein